MPIMQRLKYFGIALLVIFGGALIFMGFTELELAKHALPEPQQTSLMELSANGYGDNAHVAFDDAYLIYWDYIYMEKGGRFASDQWEYAYVPAVSLQSPWYQAFEAGLDADNAWPEGRAMPPFDQIPMVFKLPDARSPEDIFEVAQQIDYQGVVINEIESLADDEKELLSESFPNTDFESCLIFELGREPTTPDDAKIMIGVSAAVLLLGLVLAFFAWRRYQEEQLAVHDEGDAAAED